MVLVWRFRAPGGEELDEKRKTGGFYLAVKSIATGYTGALTCWTVVFTPIGTACSIVLARIVDKSRAENTSADGEGIKYAAAKANRFVANTSDLGSVDSPSI